MEINIDIVKVELLRSRLDFFISTHGFWKVAGLHEFDDIIDPTYLLGLTDALKKRLEGGAGLTSLRLCGKVSITGVMYPITYLHLFKISWWLGFLAAEKIRFVSEKYRADSILLDAEAVEQMSVWIECCRGFLEAFIREYPDKKMKHLPWNEETVRRSTSDQIRAVVALSGHL